MCSQTTPPFQKSEIKKILLVRNDNIGDVVCTLPCIEALRRHFPDAFIAILVCRLTEEIVTGHPYLDKVYVYDKAKHGRYKFVLTAWWKQWQVLREIRDDHFDLAIGIRSEFSPSQGWLVYASRACYRLGIEPSKRHEKRSFFYNIFVKPMKESVHEVERSLHVLRRIGVDIDEKRLILRFFDDNVEKAQKFLSKSGIFHQKPLVCLNYSRRLEEGRYWEDQNYLKVIESLVAEGLQIIVTTVPYEVQHVTGLLKKLSADVPLYSSKSIKDFAGMIAQCDLFVTLQGGPMHVAAAVGTPTLALFGRNNPQIWAPWGEGHMVLRKGNDVNLITSDDVVEAVKEMLARKMVAA